jgi:hypothetical protein
MFSDPAQLLVHAFGRDAGRRVDHIQHVGGLRRNWGALILPVDDRATDTARVAHDHITRTDGFGRAVHLRDLVAFARHVDRFKLKLDVVGLFEALISNETGISNLF